ncbi:hypothetical protein HYC85_009943 [Camellia sinensis]|uniref:Uncharacterized protein n=1 Tax=Camellia sinensis TaxID=4442 RepID=A0A7J7HH10_CAMSI|nr:hypothetical protein HYC85_009943 [Camellia sinensis]
MLYIFACQRGATMGARAMISDIRSMANSGGLAFKWCPRAGNVGCTLDNLSMLAWYFTY